jgi:hypothetical protein
LWLTSGLNAAACWWTGGLLRRRDSSATPDPILGPGRDRGQLQRRATAEERIPYVSGQFYRTNVVQGGGMRGDLPGDEQPHARLRSTRVVQSPSATSEGPRC